MSDLRKRVITAIFFVIAMIGGILAGELTFVLLFGIILSVCLWEFYSIVLPGSSGAVVRAMLPGLLPFMVASASYIFPFGPDQVDPLQIILWLGVLFCLLMVTELLGKSPNAIHRIAYITMGTLYIGVPFGIIFLIAFHGGYYRTDLLLGLLFLTWINDTGAYFSGSLLGKTPLMPSVSPKKTLEGAIGGLFFNLLFCLALQKIFPSLDFPNWAALGLIASVFGILGDLAESLLKRTMNVKDSGNTLPGHGGFLDRFDAFIFIIPFAAIYLTLFNS